MAKTVDEGFRAFLAQLTPTQAETEAAKSHRASIKACLESKFEITRFFRTGSFGNGTSISGYSDVDYFAVIPTSKLKQKSSVSLSAVREALETRFPNTGVMVSCPAVVVPFGTGGKETTEVVPADYWEKSDGYDVFEIADCEDGWMRSSPDAHNAYVREIDNSLGNKVKPLIRFIKAWKYYCNVPISSFYLELRIAKWASTEPSIVYAQDVRTVLKVLNDNGLAQMQDPKGISGYIRACSTDAKLEDAKSKLATAVSRAQKAVDAERAGKTEQAFDWWNILYAGNFGDYES